MDYRVNFVLKGGMTTLADFFNGNLTSVSHLNIFIAIHADYPEWLRGITAEKDLPRRALTYDLPHKVVAPVNAALQAQAVAWIVDNLSGAWNITQTWVFFENDLDAVKYMLRWSD